MAFGATAAMAQPALDQVASCASCSQFEETCALKCSNLDADKAARENCLMSCAKVVSDCSRDDSITLSSEFLVEMGYAKGPSALKAACNGPYTCPAQYASCASWSSYADCGDTFCGVYKFCGDPPSCYEPDFCFGPAERQRRERFRVCLNSTGQSCTEFQQTNYPVSCGC